jgi:hypothetical protein
MQNQIRFYNSLLTKKYFLIKNGLYNISNFFNIHPFNKSDLYLWSKKLSLNCKRPPKKRQHQILYLFIVNLFHYLLWIRSHVFQFLYLWRPQSFGFFFFWNSRTRTHKISTKNALQFLIVTQIIISSIKRCFMFSNI